MTTCPQCGNAHSDDCTPAALKARIVALSKDHETIPRHLLIALSQAQRAFERRDRSAFGTINESVQPVADAALGWIREVEADRDDARAQLAWHEENNGTRAEQEAEAAWVAEEQAAVDELSDEEVQRLNEAEGIDTPARRQRFDAFLRVLTRETVTRAKLVDVETERDTLAAKLAEAEATIAAMRVAKEPR